MIHDVSPGQAREHVCMHNFVVYWSAMGGGGLLVSIDDAAGFGAEVIDLFEVV